MRFQVCNPVVCHLDFFVMNRIFLFQFINTINHLIVLVNLPFKLVNTIIDQLRTDHNARKCSDERSEQCDDCHDDFCCHVCLYRPFKNCRFKAQKRPSDGLPCRKGECSTAPPFACHAERGQAFCAVKSLFFQQCLNGCFQFVRHIVNGLDAFAD